MGNVSELSVAVSCQRLNVSTIFSLVLLEACFKLKIFLNPQFTKLDEYDLKLGFNETAKLRDSGIKFSAFGELWDLYGLQFCENDELLYKVIEDEFVKTIDYVSSESYNFQINESYPKQIDIRFLIDIFNPSFVEGGIEFEKNFNMALDFAQVILERVKIYYLEKVILLRAQH